MRSISRQSGFTLIEILVAMSIFAVIAAMSYTTMSTYVDHRERLAEHYTKLQNLQRLFILIERDLRFVISRPVRNESGDEEEAILVGKGGELIRLTLALPDVQSPTGTTLARVAWRLDGDELTRVVWEVLDRDSGSESSEKIIETGVEEVELQYYWYTPSGTVNTAKAESTNSIPDGMELVLTLENGVSYRRVFEMVRS